MNLKKTKEILENEGFNITIPEEEYKYFFKNMKKLLGYEYTEFGLAIKILMAHYKGLSDFFILANYLSISINVEINKIQQTFEYKEFRPFLEEAVRFRAEYIIKDEQTREKFIENKMVVYDTFLDTQDGKMRYDLEHIDEKIKNKIKKIFKIEHLSDDVLEVIVREKIIQFWTNINRALLSLYEGKDIPVPLSLGFSMKEKGRLETLDYRIQADPVVNFHGIRNWTYRLLASKVIDFDELGYDEYTSIYKDNLWAQKLHIWCGTTNSGKSTSIISAINYMYQTKKKKGEEFKIYTIEDPIEKKINFGYQLQVDYYNPNPERRITFSDGIKSAMRNSPKVIVVGEIRDLDTGIEALNAAISGHITISTIHTNTSFSVFQRLKNLGGGNSGISLNDILTGLGIVTTTNLLTTYPLDKTIPLKDLVKVVELDNGKKTYLFLKYFGKKKDKITGRIISDQPIIDDFFYALIEYFKIKKEKGKVEKLEGNYPTLYKVFNAFKRFSKFYMNNVYIDYGNKLDIFDNFIKWFEYTMINQRVVYKPVSYKETGMKPVMEVLLLNDELVNLLQTAKGEEEIYNRLCENEKTFLPRFYFAYVKNKKLIEEKKQTFNFVDIVNLANIGYVFRV